MKRKTVFTGFCALFILLALSPPWAQKAPADPAFQAALAEQRPRREGARIGALSDYLPALAGTAMDSPVYIIDPPELKPGMPAILILGGTHGDEIAGVMAASLFVSWARPLGARLLVLPRANASAATYPDPERPGPPSIIIAGASGERRFRYGSRFTAPEAELLPDPESFYPGQEEPGAQGPVKALPGREARNLNRNYPGKPDGSLTSRTAAAIFALIRKEGVRVAIDLHEAGPVSGLAWDIIAHPKNIAYAAIGAMAVEDRGVKMVLDQSRKEHWGLSHREWGEGTDAAAYLIETLNPGQVTGGRPDFDHLGNSISPLWKRVGIQVETVLAILGAHSELDEEADWALIEGMPGLDNLRLDLARYY